MVDLARLLILFGVVLLVVGAALLLAPKIPLIGRLPGDFVFHSGGTTVYVPLATAILLSLVLSVLLNLFWR